MSNLQDPTKIEHNKKTIIIGLFNNSPCLENNYQIEELERLINTLGGTVIDKIIQYKKTIDPKFYIFTYINYL